MENAGSYISHNAPDHHLSFSLLVFVHRGVFETAASQLCTLETTHPAPTTQTLAGCSWLDERHTRGHLLRDFESDQHGSWLWNCHLYYENSSLSWHFRLQISHAVLYLSLFGRCPSLEMWRYQIALHKKMNGNHRIDGCCFAIEAPFIPAKASQWRMKPKRLKLLGMKRPRSSMLCGP